MKRILLQEGGVCRRGQGRGGQDWGLGARGLARGGGRVPALGGPGWRCGLAPGGAGRSPSQDTRSARSLKPGRHVHRKLPTVLWQECWQTRLSSGLRHSFTSAEEPCCGQLPCWTHRTLLPPSRSPKAGEVCLACSHGLHLCPSVRDATQISGNGPEI